MKNKDLNIPFGARVKLRMLSLTDSLSLYEILSDSETMQYYPKTYTLLETKDWIERSIKSYETNGYGLWAIELNDNGKFIGQCGISNQMIEGQLLTEIGFHIHKCYWRNGYGFEAASLSLNHGFYNLGLNDLYIITSINNIPAQKMAQRLHMKLIKRFHKHFEHNTMEHLLFQITQKQWEIINRN